jgi:polyhydroxybutyrate depolymerase
MARIGVVLFFMALFCLFPGTVTIITGREKGQYLEKSIQWGGLRRTFILYLPARKSLTPRPLVLVLHGGGGTAKGMTGFTLHGFDRQADKEGFLVCYPDAIEKHWNDGRKNQQYRAQKNNIDDTGFLTALIDHCIRHYQVDPARVYMTGASNGALMSYRMACEASGKIAAIAPVICPMGESVYLGPKPSFPISVLIINGTDDPLAPYRGGEIHFGRKKLGRVISTQETVEYFVRHNCCNAVPVSRALPDRDPSDGVTVQTDTYGNGREESEVILYTLAGGGHTWPGGTQYLPERIVGKVCRDFDGCTVIGEFFKKHRRGRISS